MLPWACQIGLSVLLSLTQMFDCPSAAIVGQNVMMDKMAA
jgi:hypothetical protein